MHTFSKNIFLINKRRFKNERNANVRDTFSFFLKNETFVGNETAAP